MSDHEGLQVVDQYAGLEVRRTYTMPVEQSQKQFATYPYDQKVQNHDLGALQLDTRAEKGNDTKICGLKKPVFWALIAVSAALIVAVGVGAGVGASMSHNKTNSTSGSSGTAEGQTASSSTAASTSFIATSTAPASTPASTVSKPPSTSTDTSPTPFPSSGILAVDCPGGDNSTYDSTPSSSSTTYSFLIQCGTNYVVSPAAITGFNITTLDACMDKCATYNDALSGTRTACAAVTFQANLTAAESPLQRANCWLAGTTSGGISSDNGLLVSAEITGKSTS